LRIALVKLLGVVTGVLTLAGALTLLWGSTDAMAVLIHWVGEERALGPRSVIRQPGGGTLLTNPSAMMRWVLLIWAVGFSQAVAGVFLIGRSFKRG